MIWIHDYHLMLMGRYLREVGSTAHTGFFLHIPFPAPDIFEKLPWRRQILRSLLHYQLLGFQTDRDRYNFLSCLERIVPEASTVRDDPYNTVTMEGLRTRVGTFPISIAFEEFANHAASHEVETGAIRETNRQVHWVGGGERQEFPSD
jgi:trehalose 6-phosphate synthase